MPDLEIEDSQLGVRRIRGRLMGRIGRSDVSVVEISNYQSTPPRGGERIMGYADPGATTVLTGTRLLLMASTPDVSAWPAIDAAFAEEGFEKFGPRAPVGNQCYQHRHRAWFVVPAHPGATLPIEQTGMALLGWIKTA